MAMNAAVLGILLQSCAPNVAPPTMLAVVQVESEGDPYRIGVNSGASLSRQPSNAADAIATARGLLRRGANFDAGLMQINSANFARLGITAETVFDPCTNLRAGSLVLSDNYTRARNAGVRDALRAAISEYNTGSRLRGFTNGYVGRVYAAAGSAFSRPGIRYAGLGAQGRVSANAVGQLLVDTFGGRVTDAVRPVNASYGAENSYHKYGQAIDFVPRGGVMTITRAQIRALMAAHDLQILELLGPGDPGHSDHWHLAFAPATSAPNAALYAAPLLQTVARAPGVDATAPEGPVAVEAALIADNGDADPAAAPAPPAWDVFGKAAWSRNQQASMSGGSF